MCASRRQLEPCETSAGPTNKDLPKAAKGVEEEAGTRNGQPAALVLFVCAGLVFFDAPG
jgi:hypothetical protein